MDVTIFLLQSKYKAYSFYNTTCFTASFSIYEQFRKNHSAIKTKENTINQLYAVLIMDGIGLRSIKMAIGAVLAIWLVILFNLEYATFAAIIVIICIEDSKMKTLLAMREKFIASILALFLGALFLELFGYHPITF